MQSLFNGFSFFVFVLFIFRVTTIADRTPNERERGQSGPFACSKGQNLKLDGQELLLFDRKYLDVVNCLSWFDPSVSGEYGINVLKSSRWNSEKRDWLLRE